MVQAAAQDEISRPLSLRVRAPEASRELEEYTAVEVALNLPLLALKTAAVGVFSNTAVPPKLTDLIPRIAPRPTMFIWAPNGGNVEWMNPVHPACRSELVHLGDRRRQPHPRLGGSSRVKRVARFFTTTQPCLKLSGERPICSPRRMQRRRPRGRTRTRGHRRSLPQRAC